MNTDLINDYEYKTWLSNLKVQVRQVQIKAVVKVNTALLEFYWQLGASIIDKQKSNLWGEAFLVQLSRDLMAEFPDIKGFSKRNLELMRQWHLFWVTQERVSGERNEIVQSVIARLTLIPWGHNIVIQSKCNTHAEALFYVENTLQYGWSRSVLVHQIDSGLYQRKGKAVSNFATTLPGAQSDLATQTLKDPYVFDFLTLTEAHNERELENSLTSHITQFLLELGAGFAYMGRQYKLPVGERDFYLDLLFYHTQLRSYVVIELKTVEFEPEHAGKLNFYLKAVDLQLKQDTDQPSIGILLCKGKDSVVVEYALMDIHSPMGVSEYQLTQALPDELKTSLPSIEAIEKELDRSNASED